MANMEATAILCVALAFMSLSLQGCGGGGGGGGGEDKPTYDCLGTTLKSDHAKKTSKASHAKAGDCPEGEEKDGDECGWYLGKVSHAKAGDKVEVTCPEGSEYDGEVLECGWYDKVCPAGSGHHCKNQYGLVTKGSGLEEWPNISPVVSKKSNHEEHHKLRRLKEDKKDDDKKTTTLAPLSFNCLNGAASWKFGWSLEKADYCCREIDGHECKVKLPEEIKLDTLKCVKKEKKSDDKEKKSEDKEEKFELGDRLNFAGSKGPSVSAFVLAASMTFAVLGAVVALARRSRAREPELVLMPVE